MVQLTLLLQVLPTVEASLQHEDSVTGRSELGSGMPRAMPVLLWVLSGPFLWFCSLLASVCFASQPHS